MIVARICHSERPVQGREESASETVTDVGYFARLKVERPVRPGRRPCGVSRFGIRPSEAPNSPYVTDSDWQILRSPERGPQNDSSLAMMSRNKTAITPSYYLAQI